MGCTCVCRQARGKGGMARAGKRRYNFMGGSSSSSLSEEASSFICGPLWSLSLSLFLSRSVGLSFGRSPLEGITAHNRSERGDGEQNGDLTRVVCRSFGFLFPPQTVCPGGENSDIHRLDAKEGGEEKEVVERGADLPSFHPFLSPLFTTCRKCQKSANTFKRLFGIHSQGNVNASG